MGEKRTNGKADYNNEKEIDNEHTDGDKNDQCVDSSNKRKLKAKLKKESKITKIDGVNNRAKKSSGWIKKLKGLIKIKKKKGQYTGDYSALITGAMTKIARTPSNQNSSSISGKQSSLSSETD